MEKKIEIKITRETIDGIRERKVFKTLKGAQNYLRKWFGECGSNDMPGYIVDDYGVSKAYVSGATFKEIFDDGKKEETDQDEYPLDYAGQGSGSEHDLMMRNFV